MAGNPKQRKPLGPSAQPKRSAELPVVPGAMEDADEVTRAGGVRLTAAIAESREEREESTTLVMGGEPDWDALVDAQDEAPRRPTQPAALKAPPWSDPSLWQPPPGAARPAAPPPTSAPRPPRFDPTLNQWPTPAPPPSAPDPLAWTRTGDAGNPFDDPFFAQAAPAARPAAQVVKVQPPPPPPPPPQQVMKAWADPNPEPSGEAEPAPAARAPVPVPVPVPVSPWASPHPEETSNPNTQVGRVFPDKIYRFRRSERMLHWSLALPFLTCLGTAAVLFVLYNQYPLLGGRPIFSWIHRIGGACLVALPALAILLNLKDYKTHLANIKEGWKWDLDEVKWLFLMPLAAVKKSIKLPEEGKFNAAEKLNFMSSMGTTAVMAITGVIIWISPFALGAWFVHLAMAAMVLPLIGGHIFMATINPGSRVGLPGMINGWVSRHWASHHYRRWYRQIIARHLQQHGRVPELDTTEHEEEPPESITERRRAFAKLRWVITGTAVGLALAAAVGATAWALYARLPRLGPQPAGEAVAPVVMYVTQAQPLLLKPAKDSPPSAPEPLPVGAKVTQVAEAGEFVMVQDPQSRAGYLPKAVLSATAPAPVPTVEFTDCAPAQGETTSGNCEARAASLRDACVTKCPESRKAVCSEICEDRFSTCVDACEAPFAKAAPKPPDPKPAPQRAPPPPPKKPPGKRR